MAVRHASIKRNGTTFEVLLDNEHDAEDAATYATIFRSISKAERASRKDLIAAFGTSDEASIARTILRETATGIDEPTEEPTIYNWWDEPTDGPRLQAVMTELRRTYTLPEKCMCGNDLTGDFTLVLQNHGLRIGNKRDIAMEADRLYRKIANLDCIGMERKPEGTLLLPVALDRWCKPAIRRHTTVLQRVLLDSSEDGVRSTVAKYEVVVHEHERLFAELTKITGGRFTFKLHEDILIGKEDPCARSGHRKTARELKLMRHRNMKLLRNAHNTGAEVDVGM